MTAGGPDRFPSCPLVSLKCVDRRASSVLPGRKEGRERTRTTCWLASRHGPHFQYSCRFLQWQANQLNEAPMLNAILVMRGEPGAASVASSGLMAKILMSRESASPGRTNHLAPPP